MESLPKAYHTWTRIDHFNPSGARVRVLTSGPTRASAREATFAPMRAGLRPMLQPAHESELHRQRNRRTSCIVGVLIYGLKTPVAKTGGKRP